MLDIRLSSYEFRTYRKRTGLISLRHRSYLLVTTNASFRLSAYLSDISARLTLPDASEVELTGISFTENIEFPYDGETMVHKLWLSEVTTRTTIPKGLGQLTLDYEFSFAGHPDRRRLENPAIIKPLPFYRPATP